MALAAALAVNHHLLCFSKPSTVAWLPAKLKPQKRAYLSVTSCSSSSSSSSSSPKADVQTAEACINLGLSLFSKGRVFYFLLFVFFEFQLCCCAFMGWVCLILVFLGSVWQSWCFDNKPCWGFLYLPMDFPPFSCFHFDMVWECNLNPWLACKDSRNGLINLV